jgi:cell division transport system ATP-binding protein
MILEFKSVDFLYGNHAILDKSDFSLEQGEFAYLVGQSGCGKSTLLQLCYFNLLPKSGEINIAGFSSTSATQKNIPLLRQKLGIVFQDFKLLSDRTVFENLSYILEINNYPRKKIRTRVESVLSDLGILHLKNALPKILSGGEQQRTAIGRAIVNEPLLVIADEPTGNLDPETSEEIIKIFNDINRKGTAVLIATHNYDIINESAKIYKLDCGKIARVRIKGV